MLTRGMNELAGIHPDCTLRGDYQRVEKVVDVSSSVAFEDNVVLQAFLTGSVACRSAAPSFMPDQGQQ
jgi:hypothetical protein